MGYFDDPPDVPGLAHFLEHAVHLGSAKYPEDSDFKFYLSQHGGASNASTGKLCTGLTGEPPVTSALHCGSMG